MAALALATAGCGGETTAPQGGDGGPPAAHWEVVQQALPGALLSVWGTSASDVWTVGGDARDGTGPLVLHYDGTAWKRLQTGQTKGDLWWVYGFANGPVFMGGGGGVILRYENGAFTPMTTPGTDTVFGIWGASPDDLWAVGGSFDTNGFAWRLQNGAWVPEPSLPAGSLADAALWKVFGRSAKDAWLVGSGVAFHWDGSALTPGETGVGSSLFTVHANAKRYAAVGGLATGVIIENDGSGWKSALPGDAQYGLTGVVLGADDTGYAVGQYMSLYARDGAGWHEEDIGLSVMLDLHGVWLDPSGGAWAVGGQTASFPLTDGILIHKGDVVASGGI
jgi:hypothetical protein